MGSRFACSCRRITRSLYCGASRGRRSRLCTSPCISGGRLSAPRPRCCIVMESQTSCQIAAGSQGTSISDGIAPPGALAHADTSTVHAPRVQLLPQESSCRSRSTGPVEVLTIRTAAVGQNPTIDSRKDPLETGNRHFDVPFTGVAESIDIGPPILNSRERPVAIDSPFHHLPSVTGSSKA